MDAVATAKLALDKSDLENGLAGAKKSFNKFAEEVGGIFAGALALDKVISGFEGAIQKGAQLADLADRFGVSAVSIQNVGNAASLTGAGIEDVAGAMNKLARNAGEAIGGSTELQDAFKRIGLGVEDLKAMSPEDLFMALSKAISSGAIPQAEQFSLAIKLAGRNVGVLMTLLREGPDAINKTGEGMIVMSEETIRSLKAAEDQIKQLQITTTSVFGLIAAGINPVVEAFQQFTAELMLAGMAAKNFMSGDFQSAAADMGALKSSHAESLKPKEAKARHLVTDGESGPSGAEAKAAAKEFADSEKEAAVQELKLIEAKIKGEQDAQKMAEKFEKDVAEEKIKLAKENSDIQARYDEDLFKAEQDARRFEESERLRMIKAPREAQQAQGTAAGETLNFASGLGDRTISDTVTRERAKAAKEQQKVNKEEFDQKVMSSTKEFVGGNQRTMASRREEFIKSQAGKEAQGQKTLADVYSVLDQALQTLLKAPIVGSGA
jgi:hypothetical protein